MATTKFLSASVVSLFCLIISPTYAENSLGQTIQVNTHFSDIQGKPTWVLIVRDVQTQQVSPYLFDIKKNDNFWVAFTYGHTYRITASSLQFSPTVKIDNFCHLENGIIDGKSYWVSLTGKLSPNPTRFSCHVLKYKDMPFPIAKREE